MGKIGEIQMKHTWPVCKTCGIKLTVSKFGNKFICKNCNEVFESKDVLASNEILNYKKKIIRIIEVN